MGTRASRPKTAVGYAALLATGWLLLACATCTAAAGLHGGATMAPGGADCIAPLSTAAAPGDVPLAAPVWDVLAAKRPEGRQESSPLPHARPARPVRAKVYNPTGWLRLETLSLHIVEARCNVRRGLAVARTPATGACSSHERCTLLHILQL